MTTELKTRQVADAYDRWAVVYDLVFGPVFRAGRGAAIAAANAIGGRVLEVGVGTGLSLAGYDRRLDIVGIDISASMLEKARQRRERLGLAHVGRLAVMDAERLDFPDDSFDVVVAQYVVTAVPNPERALDEFVRVLRPGGEIVITTRIGAETGLRSVIEKRLMPLTTQLGWRTDFPWERYGRWLAANPALRLAERRPLPPLGHFSLLRVAKPAAAAAMPAPRSGAAQARYPAVARG
ncbi:class I SAM-dependent methyltransferase [Roseomonas sp. OT10]|uniref:class I SAM-dependent methyltransferase n=1 Tax=Roseomonas cutis TaxID=2897332 RepID=UPI001E3E2B6F|nr:class I SAM-dependent methyltransferase [Roseomonas sp. OT10]UFN47140.1 class I SAM-dependent methyltransferase [Roseomonas sp. OT10]